MKQHTNGAERQTLSRRSFLTGAAAAAMLTPAVTRRAAGARVLGANDRLGIGFIGIGIRGEILMRTLLDREDAQVVGVCDVYDGHFERAGELMADGLNTTRDYRTLLDNPDLDAVVIATPDHWHRQMTLDALAAGKDVYIEKPMTYRWEDAKDFVTAAKQHRRIVQVGSQYESMPINEQARSLLSSGALGEVTLVSGQIHRNTATGAWYYPIAPDASPDTIDWKRFLGPAPWHEFDPARFFQWRLYRDYSGGLPTDLFVHLVTATHVLMGARMPSRVTAMGNIYHWKKDREVPDQMSAIAEYPEGFALTLTATANNGHRYPLLTIMGTEGTLEYWGDRVVHHREPMLENYSYSTASWPEETRATFARRNDLDPDSMRPRATADVMAPDPEEFRAEGDATARHLSKFLAHVRDRSEPVENAEMGGRCATVGHMVNLSQRAGTHATWNEESQTVEV
jgi:predicted dehydrogenase